MKRLVLVGAMLPIIFATAVSAADTINAAGASFPVPIYQKWFEEYKAKTGVQINYQGNGSSAGVKAITEGTVDFAASDAPMTDDQLKAVKVKTLHFPTVLGAVVITYNVPGAPVDLKFSGDTIAGIYLGTITKWNDPKIMADNPGAKVPGTDIVVVHRADGSGTSFIFTDYLSKVSAAWKTKVGAANSVSWPIGLSAPQNAGVAGLVKNTPGSIGYVELIYAVQNKMSYADIKNVAGKFVKPSFESVTGGSSRNDKGNAGRFPSLDLQRPGRRSVSDFQLYLDAHTQPDLGRDEEESNRRLSELDAHRRPEGGAGTKLCATARRCCGKGKEANRINQVSGIR